jgi:hypothetical protein
VTWRRQGVVIPAPPPAHTWARTHSMVPVPTIGPNDELRVFFSTRDGAGRSHTVSATVDLTGAEGPTYRHTPVLVPGPLGSFDDSGAMASSIVENQGRFYLYYIGWNRGVTVPFTTFIGCAVSDDGGETFERVSPAPILGRSTSDPYLATSPWVAVENGCWRMWYVSGTGWPVVNGVPRHMYRVTYAESDDGIVWRPSGRRCVDFRGNDEYAIARPCVVRDADTYRMWYCSRGDAYRIGYAVSDDGLTWERMDDSVGFPHGLGWDSEMQCYPAVFDLAGRRHMLYNGNGFGATGIGHAVLE